MSISRSAAAKNAAADSVVDLVDGGSPGLAVLKDNGGTTFATITLNNAAFEAAGTNGTPGVSRMITNTIGGGSAVAGTAGADADLTTLDGTVEFQKSDATVVFTCSLSRPSANGGTGDIKMDRNAVLSGDSITIASFTYTASDT